MPLSAIVFGGRRARLAPLVFESRDWAHGVFIGATMGSETTAAATGQVGVVRRDPMAMLPFCGYNMGDYFAHWLRMGQAVTHPPAIFHVNWFRTDERGRFVWPGFGENLRVLLWMIERVKGRAAADETPIGLVPTEAALNWDGLRLGAAERQSLLRVDRAEWASELPEIRAFFDRFGDRLPGELDARLSRPRAGPREGRGVAGGSGGAMPPEDSVQSVLALFVASGSSSSRFVQQSS